MGGKSGGALSVWLKEFVSLVFTQAIQAFIYAIVITVILSGMVNDEGITDVDINSAIGLMATFALLSVFKVEAIVKQIFGIKDTKASPGNAMKSIAKTAIAAQMGKRVLDNTGKVLGGVRAINKSRQDNKKVKKRLEEDMQDEGFKMDKDGHLTPIGGASRAGGTAIGSGSSTGSGSEGGGSSIGSTAGTGGASGSYRTDSDEAAAIRRIRKARRAYEDQRAEIKEKRNQGYKDIFSGSAEIVGSVFGGTAGAILGGADGNIDEALQGLMAGAGAGDAIMASAVDTVDRTVKLAGRAGKFAKRVSQKDFGMSSKQLEKVIDNAFRDAAKNSNRFGGASSVDDTDF